MKNYIPLDFFTNNKTTVYVNKDVCERNEGSVVSFDPLETDLDTVNIVDNEVVIDQVKADAKVLKKLENEQLSLDKKNRKLFIKDKLINGSASNVEIQEALTLLL